MKPSWLCRLKCLSIWSILARKANSKSCRSTCGGHERPQGVEVPPQRPPYYPHTTPHTGAPPAPRGRAFPSERKAASQCTTRWPRHCA